MILALGLYLNGRNELIRAISLPSGGTCPALGGSGVPRRNRVRERE